MDIAGKHCSQEAKEARGEQSRRSIGMYVGNAATISRLRHRKRLSLPLRPWDGYTELSSGRLEKYAPRNGRARPLLHSLYPGARSAPCASIRS
eukprot:scaffold139309_cov30-Tisochrysis_lutea.AAC.1